MNTRNEIISYFKKLVYLLENLLEHPHFPDEYKTIFQKIRLKNSETLSATDLIFIISHIEAAIHNLKIKIESSVFLPFKLLNKIESILSEGHKILEHCDVEKPTISNPTNSTYFSANSATTIEEHQKEAKLHAEQRWLHNPNQQHAPFNNFLHEIWLHALNKHLPSKKIFISYAWPIENFHMEKWTKRFITRLGKHLNDAGLQVYLDEIHSGPGMWLRKFMGKIHEMDCVIVINSRTMHYKLGLQASGVNYEAERINEAMEKNKTIKVINVLLNNGMYCHEAFRNFPWVSFFQHGYLDGLKQLIGKIYDCQDDVAFDLFWYKQVRKNHVPRFIWNMVPAAPYSLPRNDLIHSLKINLSQAKWVICYGEESIGKSELIRHYIYQNFSLYKKIYWFNATSEDQLIQQYIELASSENINITTHDISPVLRAFKVKKWLEDNAEGNLIIFNDVKSLNEIRQFIPTCPANIIITMRDPGNIADFLDFLVPPFTDSEANNFIKQTIGSKKFNAENNMVPDLIATIGTRPDRLAYACGHIQRNRKTINGFLKQYSEIGEALLQQVLLPIQSSVKLETSIDRRTTVFFKTPISSLLFIHVKAYLENLNTKILMVLHESTFHLPDEIREILLELQRMIQHNADNDSFWTYYFPCMLSHLEAISLQLKKITNFDELIKNGHDLLKGGLFLDANLTVDSDQSSAIYSITGSSCIVVNQEDNFEKELLRNAEQQDIDSLVNQYLQQNNAFKLFLTDIRKYALGVNNNRAYASKKVYIFLTDKEAYRKEEWVHSYVNTIRKHLIYAGFIVFLDDLSQPTHKLSDHPEIDHILLISHRNQSTDLDTEILNHPNFIAKKRCFVIPVLLNNVNYLSATFKEIAELSFYKEHYLNAMRTIIRTLYHIDHDEFDIYWHKRLIFRKIKSNTWNVPTGTAYFVGRQLLLDTLKSRLIDQSDNNQLLVLTAATVGMGGVGKTSLALQFIRLYGHEYSHIYWINGESRESIIQSFLKLGIDKKIFKITDQRSIEEKVFAVKNWLENESQQGWLLVFDNVDKYDKTILDEFIPHRGGKVLVISRHTQWDNVIPVDVFSTIEAHTYIKDITGSIDNSDITELARMLGYLPLALAQACFYIKYNKVSIREYLTLYSHNKKHMLSENTLPSNEHISVYITWNITFQKIMQESPLALRLLQHCAYLSNSNIQESVIEDLFHEEHVVALDTAKRVASEYSIIAINDQTQSFSLHCVLQEVIREHLQTSEKDIIINKLINFFHKNFKFSRYPDVNDINRYHLLRSHIEALHSFCATSIKLVAILHEIGQYYLYQLGDYHYAEKYLLLAYSTHVDVNTHEESKALKTERAFVLNSLGRLYLDLFELNKDINCLDKSRRYYSESYKLKKSIYDKRSEDHFWTMGTQHSLGRVHLEYALFYKDKDVELAHLHLEKSEMLFKKIIAFRENEQFANDRKKQVYLGQSYGEYAYLLIEKNNLEESAIMFQRSLSIFERNLGHDFGDAAWVRHRKAHLLLKQHKFEEALNEFLTAIDNYCQFYTSRQQNDLFHPRIKVVFNDLEKAIANLSEIPNSSIKKFNDLTAQYKFDSATYPEIMRIQAMIIKMSEDTSPIMFSVNHVSYII